MITPGAAREAGKEADQNVDDRADTTDGGIVAGDTRLPDNICIDHIIKLLKKVADQKGNGKGQKVAHYAALCHILLAAFTF